MPNRLTLPVAVGLAVAAAVLAGGVIGGGVIGGGTGLGSDGGPEAVPGPTPTSQPAPTSGTTPSGAPDARAGSPRAGGTSEASRPGTTTATGTTTGGVEVIPPEATDAPSEHLPGLDDVGPDGEEPAALPRWRDLPDSTEVAQGRLARGYPRSLLPTAPRAAVVTSSVSPSGPRVQVALTATGGAEPSTVVGFYRRTLLRAGFTEVRSPEVGGATSAAFRRGPDRVVVTVDPAPAHTYSVYGTFDTDGA